NAGVLTPVIPFGTNDYNGWNAELGYGAFLKKQLAPSFALKLDFHRGNVSADYDTNDGRSPITPGTPASFDTEIHYAIALKGVANVGSIDFLRRSNAINFFVQAGAGLVDYKAYPNAANEDDQNVRELYIPIGAGI